MHEVRCKAERGKTGLYWVNSVAESPFAVAEYIEAFYNRIGTLSTIDYHTPVLTLNNYRSAAAVA